MTTSSPGWLEQALWEYSPDVLRIGILAVSLLVARAVFLVLARRMHFRHNAALLGAAVLGGTVFVGMLFGWNSIPVVPDPAPMSFTADAWVSKPWLRWAMAQHLVESGQLLGMEREEVRLLLGDGDGSYDGPSAESGEVPPGDHGPEVDELDKWMLYRPRDMLFLIPPSW
ncbi:MAG: hypothetical protein Q7W44_05130 [Coriobacteriia bacterium]|nr:hypothetical protein [Coriobacteriia bacterium]